MRKKSASIDGFIPRRANSLLGEQHGDDSSANQADLTRPKIGKASREITPGVIPRSTGSISRSEVDESLADIDNEEPVKKKRGFFRRRRNKRILTRKQKIIKRIIIAIIILAVLIGGFIFIRAFLNSSKIFKGNIFDVFQNQPLKMDSNGRTNILVFGTSEDDPGHEAGSLTDSIMVVSVDQNKKNAYMVSIPRDLSVDYGAACVAGYAGKINVLYGCYSEDGKNETDGATALKKKVGEVLGLDVQYYAHVNYTVVRDVVKAIDGITVDIQGSGGDPGIMDSNFDWKCKGGDQYASYATKAKNCPPNGHFIEYKNGPAKLDAEHALYLAQARGDLAPTYGLGRSNFDREINQQKIVKAIRQKAVSVGTLTNIGKVTSLMDALGDNLRTDFATGEIRTLLQLGTDIPSDAIQSIPLVEQDGKGQAFFTSQNGTSDLIPIAGAGNFTELQNYIKRKLSSNPVIREEANIVVLNGSGQVGRAQAESDTLTGAGYTVISMGNAPDGSYGTATVYQLTKEKPNTAKALAKRYGVELTKTAPAFEVAAGVDFVVVVGKAAANTTD